MIPKENWQILGCGHKRHLMHQVADKATVIRALIDGMQNNVLAGHGSPPFGNKFKMIRVTQTGPVVTGINTNVILISVADRLHFRPIAITAP